MLGSALSSIPAFLWVAFGVVVVLAGGVTVSGGLRVAESTPTDVALGTEIDLSEYSLTVHDAEFTNAVEEQYLEADAGDALVVVTMTMTNTTDRPIGITTTTDRISTGFVNVRNPLLTLPGIEPTNSVRAWRDDGSAGPVILQPGIPSTVRLAWPVPEDAAHSGSVYLDVYDAKVTTGQILLSADQVFWRRGELAARVDLDGNS